MKKIISVAALIALMLMAFPTFSAEAKKATVYHPVFGDMKVVIVGDKNAFKGGYKLWINKEGYLGAKSFRPSAYSTTLASSLAEGGSETTLRVNSITLKDGTSLAEANYGSLLILTIGTGDNEEKIAVSNLATSTKAFTIVSRGLEYGRWASSTANMKQHLPGERVYVSDDDHFLNQIYSDLVTAETITGRKTFTLSPIIPTPSSSDLTYAASIEYVNNVATSGAPNLSETIKGLGEGATQSEMAAGTATGTQAALLLQSKYATSTGGNPYVSIPVTGSDGKLGESFISEYLNLTTGAVMASTTVTATTTLAGGTVVTYPIASSSIASMGYVLNTAVQTFISSSDISTSTAAGDTIPITSLTRIITTPATANYAIVIGSITTRDNNYGAVSTGSFTIVCSRTSGTSSVSVGVHNGGFSTPSNGYGYLVQCTLGASTTLFSDFNTFSSNGHDATLSATAYYYK